MAAIFLQISCSGSGGSLRHRWYLRNVFSAVRFIYICSHYWKPAAWAFRFAILAKRLDGSKCRDCDTKQFFSSTAIAVTPACVIWPSALTCGTLGELLCPHLPECTCVFPRTGRSVSQRKPIAGNGSYES
jgi:hypothetical protein